MASVNIVHDTSMSLRKILIALIFSVLGFCGNYLNVPVAFSVDFIFGSIFAIVAAATLGMGWGIGVSVIASSYTYQLWNHPYAIIIFAAEILWISLALQRGNKNLLLIDSFYWLFVGTPLVIFFYAFLQKLGLQSVAIIVLKQTINGIFNTMVASVLLSHTLFRKLTPGDEVKSLPTYATLIFHITAASMMIPSLSMLLYMNHREAINAEKQTVANLQTDANEARIYIESWVRSHVNATKVIAELGQKFPLKPSPELQAELVSIRKLFPDYHNIFLGDAEATTIAFDPAINEKGETTIGINFADRAWFKQLKNTLKPVVSDVFMGRGGIFTPIFSISFPVVRDDKLACFGLGAVNLERLRDYLSKYAKEEDLVLIDRNENVIVSSNNAEKPLTPVAPTDNGTVAAVSPEVSLWIPVKIKNISKMNVWKGAFYFIKLPIDGTNWTLLLRYSVAPAQQYLYNLTIWGFAGLALLYALSMLLAFVLSRRIAGTPEALSTITKDILYKIGTKEKINWPRADTAEMAQLTQNFIEAEGALRKYIQEVESANETLEIKIQTRTQELDSERQRLSDIVYATDAGTWEWDIRTGEMIINERWANIIGYRLEDLTPISAQTWRNFVHPEDLKPAVISLKKHLKRETDYFEYEFRMKHKDGTWIWVRLRAKVVFWASDRKAVTMSGTLQDITTRKRIEIELRKSEERLSLALSATKDAIWDFDLVTNRLYYSPRWWEMIGYSEDQPQVDLAHWRQLLHPEDLERTIQTVSKAIKGDKAFEVEYRLRHKDGHYIPMLTRGGILRDKHNKAVRISGTNSDLTEQKRIEEERRQWERRERDQQLLKIEGLNRMAGAVAHHFNNQLSAVIGYLELAIEDPQDPEGLVENLNEALRAAERASEVSILMLTYLGKTFSEKESIDIVSLCNQMLPDLQFNLPDTIHLETDFPELVLPIECDSDQIQQVLSNLITNAAESYNGEGTIQLGITTVLGGDIPKLNRNPLDWLPKDGTYVRLEVRDSGCGMPKKDIEKCFDPFFTTKFQGRGLGLAVVLGILKIHQGAITVESIEGSGSIFRVFLPLLGGGTS